MFPWKSRRVTFEHFMDFCLYDSAHGYYATREKIFGLDGDYYTSSHTHPLFAQLLAEAFVCYFEELGQPRPFDLVELGAGEGILGRDILAQLERAHPAVFEHVRYRAVEFRNPNLPSGIQGVVFSNEFFDSLPVHRVRVQGAEVKEIYVAFNNRILEFEGEISDPRILDYMKSGFERWTDGYEYEVNLRLVSTLQELEQSFESGFLVTVDYGYEWEEYEAIDRAGGTLMCYHRHQAVSDPYVNMGEQDITAHVNFEVMKRVGAGLGWQNQPLRTQRAFMMEWGLEEKLMEEERYGLLDAERLQDRLKLKALLTPDGISDTMKVLVQVVRGPLSMGGSRAGQDRCA